MKFASLLINMNFIGQAETRRTQEKISTLCPLPAPPVLLNRSPSGCSTGVGPRESTGTGRQIVPGCLKRSPALRDKRVVNPCPHTCTAKLGPSRQIGKI